MKYRYEIIDDRIIEYPIFEDDIWGLQSLENLIKNQNHGWHIISLQSLNPDNQQFIRTKKWILENHPELLI